MLLIVQIHTFLVFQQEIEHERVFCQGIGFIFLVCKVEGAVIDARDHNTKICSIKNIRVVMPNFKMSSLS